MSRPRTETEVLARVEAWHECDDYDPGDMHDAIGWTWEEYARWVETGALPSDCQRERDAGGDADAHADRPPAPGREPGSRGE